jgi:hypothetical protein
LFLNERIFVVESKVKKLLVPVLALLALSVTQAHAIPITYSISGSGPYSNPIGSFTFDRGAGLIGTYSNVRIWSWDYYDSASGSAMELRSTGLLGTALRLTFTAPLSDAGGNISFSSYERGGLLWLVGDARATYSGGGSGRGATNVPEPGALFLLGAGLIGLGLVRRRSAAKTQ